MLESLDRFLILGLFMQELLLIGLQPVNTLLHFGQRLLELAHLDYMSQIV